MASSNRHWPSLFKSKPCSPHVQWPHDLSSSSLLSSPCQKSPFSSGGYEERSPDPKPRWNPKPEQIRILEAIFNSGMVNPPREEIRKIRSQLQEYGQVGDANVFYWFQNRKSRSKHKNRKSRFSSTPVTSSSSSSSSSGSEKSPPPEKTEKPSTVTDTCPSPAAPQAFLYEEPFFFHGLPEYYFSAAELACLVGVPEGLCQDLISDLIVHDNCIKKADEESALKMQLQQSYAMAAASVDANSGSPPTPDIVNDVINGLGSCRPRATVFINGVAFDVGTGLVNLREAFGENAVLLHSSGNPVLIDEWGVTLHPLQHGSTYFLI